MRPTGMNVHSEGNLKLALLPAALAAAALAVLPGAAAARTPTGAFGGGTSQGEVATASVAKAKTGAPTIQRFAIHWAAPNCSVGGGGGAPESTTIVRGATG